MPIPSITPIKRRKSLYSDFHKDLTINPISNDLAVKRDEEAVKESLKNLLLTDRGERLFQPSLGSDIRATLFENNTPMVVKLLEEKVRAVINNFEPRVNIIEIIIKSEYDENKIQITIYFNIRNVNAPLSVTVFLERTR
jgi:phage baseplate assembly protein W